MSELRKQIKVPSQALEAMIKGLKSMDRRKNMAVDMGTYYRMNSKKKICYGCAATATLQQISGKWLSADIDLFEDSARASFFNISRHEFDVFENAMDDVRLGYLYELFRWCRVAKKHKESYNLRFYMEDEWKSELPKVKKLIAELKSEGL